MFIYVRKLKFILTLTVVAGVMLASLAVPFSVSADSPAQNVDSESSNIFTTQLCPKLKNIKNDTLYKKNCIGYTTTSAMDKAADRICDKYGNTNKSGKRSDLRAECTHYRARQAEIAKDKKDTDSANVPDNDTCSAGAYKNGACKDPALNGNCTSNKENCDIVGRYVNPIINLLSVSFGIIAVISLIMGGIQYTASVGDPQKVSLAKRRIYNTIFAVVAYLFLYSFLQFLVPGGIFNK